VGTTKEEAPSFLMELLLFFKYLFYSKSFFNF